MFTFDIGMNTKKFEDLIYFQGNNVLLIRL